MADLGTRMASMASTQPEGPRPEHAEGAVARTIEQQTAKLPSDLFLWAAGASIVGSLVMKCCGREHDALFVGQWAAPFLVLGLYNKLVKVAGSDSNAAQSRSFGSRMASSGYSSDGGL
jgi:hypothetical protein